MQTCALGIPTHDLRVVWFSAACRVLAPSPELNPFKKTTDTETNSMRRTIFPGKQLVRAAAHGARPSMAVAAFATPGVVGGLLSAQTRCFTNANSNSRKRTAKRTTMMTRRPPSGIPSVVRPVVPSEHLKKFVEDKAMKRSDVVTAINAYATEKGLKDPSNKQIIYCDGPLTELLGVEQCTVLTLTKHLVPHLRPPQEVGGRYLDEAREIEELYLREKANRKNAPPKSRRGATRSSGQGLFKPVKLTPQLAALCNGTDTMPRQDIVKNVWAYIRAHGLKGPPGSKIRCDQRMQRVFNATEIGPQDVMRGISKNVTKLE